MRIHMVASIMIAAVAWLGLLLYKGFTFCMDSYLFLNSTLSSYALARLS